MPEYCIRPTREQLYQCAVGVFDPMAWEDTLDLLQALLKPVDVHAELQIKQLREIAVRIRNAFEPGDNSVFKETWALELLDLARAALKRKDTQETPDA